MSRNFIRFSVLCISGLFLALSASGCASGPAAVSSQWCAAPIRPDGMDDDWPPIPEWQDKDPELTIRVMNDQETLHICFATRDEALMDTLAASGLNLRIDLDGGETPTFGVHIPGLAPRTGQPDPGEKRPRNQASRPTRGERPPRGLTITYPEATGPIDMTEAAARRSGVAYGIVSNKQDGYVCEVSIQFAIQESFISGRFGETLGLGFDIVEMPTPEKPSTPPEESGDRRGGKGGGIRGGRGGGMRGGMGGRMGGGMAAGQRPDSEAMDTVYETWFQVKRAQDLGAPAPGDPS